MAVHHPRPRYGFHPDRLKQTNGQDALFEVYKQLVALYANTQPGSVNVAKHWMDKAMQALRDSRN